MADYIRHLRALVGGNELLQVPSVSIALRDDANRVLLVRHSEGDVWLLPGGAIEPGEVPSDAAVREMFEETGLMVRPTGIVGVFGGPEFVVHYRNGDRTSYVMTVFAAEYEGGRTRPDFTEVQETRFVSEEDVKSLRVALWATEVLASVFDASRTPRFRPASWSSPRTVR
jgi:ADP-ribose pyrophosphatase YjhB (NUDIX family)